MISKIAPLFGSLCLLGLMAGVGLFASTQSWTEVQDQSSANLIPLSENVQSSARSVAPLLPPRPDIFYDAITARPLFSPTRRPIEATAELVAVPEPVEALPTPEMSEQPNVGLGGVLGSIDERKALILFEDSPARWLRLGDDVDGWKITDISDKTITLSSDTRTFRLELFQ